MRKLLIIILMISVGFLNTENLTFASGAKSNLDSLVKESQAVAIGAFIKHTSYQSKDMIFTQYTFTVEEDIAKTLPTKEITIILPGGIYNGIGQHFSIVPKIKDNERTLLFLTSIDDYVNTYTITNLRSGKFDLYTYQADDGSMYESVPFDYEYVEEFPNIQKFQRKEGHDEALVKDFKDVIKELWSKK